MSAAARSYSIFRREQYELLKTVTLNGTVLDLGGSTRSGYHELIKGSPTFTTVNINADYGCDLVFDIQKPFPLEDESFDHALSLNVLEHLSDPWASVRETARILKKGGTFVGVLPFMHQIHGSPDDFYRYTSSAVEHLCVSSGLMKVRLEPIGGGLASLVFQMTGGAAPFLIREPFRVLAVFTDRVLGYSARYRLLRKRIPLGYFFVFRKA